MAVMGQSMFTPEQLAQRLPEQLRPLFTPLDPSERDRLLFDEKHRPDRAAFRREVILRQQERDWPAILARIDDDNSHEGGMYVGGRNAVQAAAQRGPRRLVHNDYHRIGRDRTADELAADRGDVLPPADRAPYLHWITVQRLAEQTDRDAQQTAAREMQLRLARCQQCGQAPSSMPDRTQPIVDPLPAMNGARLCRPCREVLHMARVHRAAGEVLSDGRTRWQTIATWLDELGIGSSPVQNGSAPAGVDKPEVTA